MKTTGKYKAELFDSSSCFYHAIATNRDEEAPDVIKLHNWGVGRKITLRAKSGFGMGWTPCGEGYASAIFSRIGVIAYNLFVAMMLLALPFRR